MSAKLGITFLSKFYDGLWSHQVKSTANSILIWPARLNWLKIFFKWHLKSAYHTISLNKYPLKSHLQLNERIFNFSHIVTFAIFKDFAKKRFLEQGFLSKDLNQKLQENSSIFGTFKKHRHFCSQWNFDWISVQPPFFFHLPTEK